jgi:DNA topoisomerase-2
MKSLNKTSGVKTCRLVGIKDLEDANLAGTSKSETCKLILTEGLSAKTFAMSAISVIGRDRFGIFPLRGKVLNVRSILTSKVSANKEICNIVKILGLQYGEKYNDVKALRYGGVIALVDADHDGHHICGLLLNFFHYFWPELVALGYVNICSTPIVKISKGNDMLSFMNMNDFKHWEAQTHNAHTYKVKYYKGIRCVSKDVSSMEEFEELYNDFAEDDKLISIDLLFSEQDYR